MNYKPKARKLLRNLKEWIGVLDDDKLIAYIEKDLIIAKAETVLKAREELKKEIANKLNGSCLEGKIEEQEKTIKKI